MDHNEKNKYREKLHVLQNRLTDEIRQVIHRMTDKTAASEELSHLPTHSADRDSEGLDRDIALEANREEILGSIQDALARIDNGTYGFCVDCGCEIPKARLEALPFAARCVTCEERQKGQKGGYVHK